MDINIKFLKSEYFSNKLENYLAQLFKTNKNVIGDYL